MRYVYRSIGLPHSRRYVSQLPHKKFTKENIDPAKFIKSAHPTRMADFVPQHSFSDFEIDPLLLANIRVKGFTTLSPIQDQAIPEGLAGKDIVGVADTGTGKTVAFALPVLHRLFTNHFARVLVMAPTRELATQIEDEFKQLAKGSGLCGALLIGGSSMDKQLQSLRRHPAIIIGTPGRIKDHIERGSLDLSSVSGLVLDEVDRMLDMGFVRDIRWIIGKLPSERQSFFFTATLNSTVAQLISEISHDPVTISVKSGETTGLVEQGVVRYGSKGERLDRLDNLLRTAPKALIFDDTQRSVERLGKELLGRGFSVETIHGGKTQGQRQRALSRFKAGEISVLVATDVAARGIDVTDISHVINYSTPRSYDDYVHRIGRTGRAGKTGFAFTFVES